MIFLFKIKAILKIFLGCILGKGIFTYRIFKSDSRSSLEENFYSLEERNKFSIVMQGPYLYDNQFTFNTLLLYRKHFPLAVIIFSTTSELNRQEIKSLSDNDVYYIYNEHPKHPGTSNINYQIVTTSSGLLKAKELGAEYVLKTRSDQRIFHSCLEDYLINLMDCFPLTGDYPKQKGRLVGCSLNTLKFRPYGVSDMFLFGYLDDMMAYWCVPLDDRKNVDVAFPDGCTWREYAANETCEIRFCANYLRFIGRKLDFSIEGSMECLARHFVIIDQDALRLIWPKYSLDQNSYKQFGDFPEISFNDWLIVYMKGHKLNFNESALDEPITKES